MSQLEDSEWINNLAFMVEMTEHLNSLNKKMQGCNKLVTQFYDSVCAFKFRN